MVVVADCTVAEHDVVEGLETYNEDCAEAEELDDQERADCE